MRIKILDKNKCEACSQRTCSMNDIITKSDFMNLRTEQYTCPVKLFAYGLTDEQLEAGYIDCDSDDNTCIYCYLCAVQCSQNNLLINGYVYSTKNDFVHLKESGELQARGPSNTIAMAYLNLLFDFAANTNLIRTINFDGAVLTKEGNACLVEVDLGDDSLECCRRVLADIILHNHKNDRKIKDGLIVLSNFPKEGSRDVVPLIRKIKEFFATEDINIYITTFSLLRYFVLNLKADTYEFDDLLFNISVNTKEEYLQKLLSSNIIDKEIAQQIFQED